MPTGTGYSGLWGTSLVTVVDRGALERATKRLGARMKVVRKLALVLNGAIAGSLATVTEGRVTASTTEQGGVRAIESNALINRVSTAADKTRIDNAWLKSSRIAPTVQPGQLQTSGSFSGRGFLTA